MKNNLKRSFLFIGLAVIFMGSAIVSAAAPAVNTWVTQPGNNLYTNTGNGLGNGTIHVAGCVGCGGGGGGIEIGTPVTSGNALSLLYVDGSGNLNNDPALTYNGVNLALPGDPTIALGAATKQYVDARAGMVSIGNTVGSSTANSVLFVDGSNKLAQDNPNFTYNTGVLGLKGSGLFGNGGEFDLGAAVVERYDGSGNFVLDNTAHGQEFAMLSSGGINIQTPSSGHGIAISNTGNTTINGTLNLNGSYIMATSAGISGTVLTSTGGTGTAFSAIPNQLVIGNPVASGAANDALYVDASGNLGQDSNFKYTASSQNLSVGNNVIANNSLVSPILSSGAAALNINTALVLGSNQISLNNGTQTSTSGQTDQVSIVPTYNQLSGTASNTDLLINRTETAIGSGTQLLIDAQTGSATQWNVDHSGNVIQNGSITLSNNKAGISLKVGGGSACMGTGTLGGGGTVIISTQCAKSNAEIFLTDTSSSITNLGSLTNSAITPGVNFTVKSTNMLDTSTFNWIIFNQS